MKKGIEKENGMLRYGNSDKNRKNKSMSIPPQSMPAIRPDFNENLDFKYLRTRITTPAAVWIKALLLSHVSIKAVRITRIQWVTIKKDSSPFLLRHNYLENAYALSLTKV